MEQVIRERARRAADQLPAESRIAASSAVDSIMLSELASEPIGVLLDVGTGSGHLLELLGANATRAVGIDISSDALRLARTNVHGAGLESLRAAARRHVRPAVRRAAVRHGDGRSRPGDRTSGPLAALSEIARTLKNGGRAVVIEDFDALSGGGRGESDRDAARMVRARRARMPARASGGHRKRSPAGRAGAARRRQLPLTLHD